MFRVLIIIGILQMSTACSVFGVQDEKGPQYRVLLKDNDKEIREYKSYIVAKTTIDGGYKDSSGKAFRKLAGYIFGKNKSKKKMEMTSPVISESKDQSEKMPMTSPVFQQGDEKTWSMSFVMPANYTIETLPEPLEEGIEFIEVPERTVAAIQYSGSRDKEQNDAKAIELKDWLVKNDNYSIKSAVYSAGYNPPWTLPAFRRNEMLYEVEKKK
ncbi:MAG: heme-binding protein [Bdellovibrionales bacterium]|nr:heme-binding protein [Bdellovibrionales bacterium]NQZ17656.1 heme-binding protein [Bdellovibrionales bacterium]